MSAPVTVSVVICTHNRANLLERLLQSLSAAEKPHDARIDVIVVANACSDRTEELLRGWEGNDGESCSLKLTWVSQPRPGKSYALNTALQLLKSDAAVFLDDDQRVAKGFLVALESALRTHPGINIFCGRLVPDWDGREPAWVHDNGRYRVFPPPIVTFDLGQSEKLCSDSDPKPPGGNLVFRCRLLADLGEFSTALGPTGHDFAGGEDNEYLQRAVERGEGILYSPGILQYHYVEKERLCLRQLLRMSYQRSFASALIHRSGTSIPRYLWRSLGGHLLRAVFSVSVNRTRFHLVRFAAVLGEMRGLSLSIDRQ